jgi:hypothetical protein
MKKGQRKSKRISLGDLIVALFEETKKVSSNRKEQNLLVSAALRDLLKGRVQSLHPIAIKAF